LNRLVEGKLRVRTKGNPNRHGGVIGHVAGTRAAVSIVAV
jgi:hypothetical protein